MTIPVFVGDEVSAAGYRLGGARVRITGPGEELEAVRWAREQSDLVLVTTQCAEGIPWAILESWLAAISPLLLIVRGVQGDGEPPNLSHMLRSQMGIG